MHILVENSSWNNIGDGFYQFSLLNLLKKCFPNAQVSHMDAPVGRSFRYKSKFAGNVFSINRFQNGDLYVFSGPILGREFFKEYGEILKNIIKAGKKYALISVHGGGELSNEIADFLDKNPPIVFMSRDRKTYDLYKSKNYPSYDGVCTATFVSKTCQVGTVDVNGGYITSSFYEGYEPEFELIMGQAGEINDVKGVGNWVKEHNWRYKRHFEWLLKKYKPAINGYKIIRPVHDTAYKFSHLNFARANSFVSYNPFIYLSLYRSTRLTITNRLHAAIATLSYGNPVVYVGNTSRNGALERLGLSDYQGKMINVPSDVIDMEEDRMIDFLKSYIL